MKIVRTIFGETDSITVDRSTEQGGLLSMILIDVYGELSDNERSIRKCTKGNRFANDTAVLTNIK